MPEPSALADDACVIRAESAVSTEIDGHAVILEIETGAIFHLNQVGSRIWRMLETDARVGDVCEVLQQGFDVPADVCHGEVLEFLDEMRRRGLVAVG